MNTIGNNHRASTLIEWKVATAIVLAEVFVASNLFCYGLFYSGFVMKEYFTREDALWPIIFYICFTNLTYPWMKSYCKQLYCKNNRRLKLKQNELIISTIGLTISIVSSGILENLTAQCLLYGICGGVFSGILSSKLHIYCEQFINSNTNFYSLIIQLPKLISLGFITTILHYINYNFGPFITQLIWGCCCANLLMIILTLDDTLDTYTITEQQQQQQQQSDEQIELQSINPQNEQSIINDTEIDNDGKDEIATTSHQLDDDNNDDEIAIPAENVEFQPRFGSDDSKAPILHRINTCDSQQSICIYLPKSLNLIKFYPLLLSHTLNLCCLILYITLLPYIISIKQYKEEDNYATNGTLVVPQITSVTWTVFVFMIALLRLPELKTPNYLYLAALLTCTICTAFLWEIRKFTIEMCCIPFGGANAILMFYEKALSQQYIGDDNWQIVKDDLCILTGITILIIYIIVYFINISIFHLIGLLPILYFINFSLWIWINYELRRTPN